MIEGETFLNGRLEKDKKVTKFPKRLVEKKSFSDKEVMDHEAFQHLRRPDNPLVLIKH